jgi:predicted DCC family thiol-disulfide oxidoreductase YuxK
MRTTAPGGTKLIALYDGACRICTREAERLARLGRDRVETRSFQEPGALEPFPGLTHDECMKRLHVVAPDGKVFTGAEAVARIVATLPVVGALAYGYYVPGVRQLSERAYDRVAKNRYRFGRADEACEGGTCHLHWPSR